MDFIIEERTSRQNNGNDLAEKRKNRASVTYGTISSSLICVIRVLVTERRLGMEQKKIF